jgi:L-ascorbate metabolism protein UlaG (beta-lactamase superfamily)
MPATSSSTLRLAILCASLCACGGAKQATPGDLATDQAVAQNSEARDSASEPIDLVTSVGEVKISPVWHGTLSFTVNGSVVVIDPWSKAPASRLPKADLILITDIHQDHFDPAAIAQVRKSESIIVAPQVVVDQLPAAIALKNGETRSELGIGITATPMYNTQRGPEPGKLFHDKGRGNGYVLTFGETRIYISGDTECTDEMRALTDIDLAFVCMNLPYTMPPAEAAECIKAFRPKAIVPYHYRGSDLDVLKAALDGEEGIALVIRDFYLP